MADVLSAAEAADAAAKAKDLGEAAAYMSGDGSKHLAGDGTFKTVAISTLPSSGVAGTVTLNVTGGNLVITGLPTASTDLTSGMVWLNSNVLTIVP